MPTSTGNTQMIRHFNEYLILEVIVQHSEWSRAEISRQTGLSKPTVSSAVQTLLQQNLIHETGPDRNLQGRKGQVLAFNEQVFYLFIMDIGPEGIRTGLADLSGQCDLGGLLSWHQMKTPAEMENLLRKQLEQEANKHGIKRTDIRFASAGISAVVHPQTGAIHTLLPQLSAYSSLLSRDSLSRMLGMEVLLDNDVNLAAEAEKEYGSAGEAAHFIYLSLGEGVGAGLMIDGKVYRGLAGAAGEWGQSHVPTARDSRTDSSTLERKLGSQGLIDLMHASGWTDIDLADEHSIGVKRLISAAQQGDDKAVRIMKQYAERLTVPLSHMVSLFAPEMIVLGGSIGQHAELFLPDLHQTLPSLVPVMPQIVVSSLTDHAVIQGAVWAGIQRSFCYIREEMLSVGGVSLTD